MKTSTYNRRDFLKFLGVAAVGTTLAPTRIQPAFSDQALALDSIIAASIHEVQKMEKASQREEVIGFADMQVSFLNARLLLDASSSPEGGIAVQLKSTTRCSVGGCGFRAIYLTTCVGWAARFCKTIPETHSQ